MNAGQLPDRVRIVDVSLRDGLQNEPRIVPTKEKIELAGALVAAGLTRIEAVSFVHPKAVPAMADAEAVMAAVPKAAGVRYSGLILNPRGLDRALAAAVDEVNLVVCASDTFSRRNQNTGRDESMVAAAALIRRARAVGLFVTATIATAFGCPFEGEVDPELVVGLAERLLAAGVDEICLADTVGVGVPNQVIDLGHRVRELAGGIGLRFHFHNTRNTGYANVYAALLAGADVLDTSVGGIGGCPFAPRATGNIATEDTLYLLDRMGVDHPGHLTEVLAVTPLVERMVGHPAHSMLARAGVFPPADERDAGHRDDGHWDAGHRDAGHRDDGHRDAGHGDDEKR